jgi:DNA-binding transcriptional MocR family regulator
MVLLRLAAEEDDEALCRWLLTKRIEAQPLSTHYAGRQKQQGLLLGFAGFTERQLVDGARQFLAHLKGRKS